MMRWLTPAAYLFACCASVVSARDVEVTLAPGEGTILLLGTPEQRHEVAKEYFSPAAAQPAAAGPAAPRPEGDKPYRLDAMPIGVYLASASGYASLPEFKGVDVYDWYGKLLDILKAGGANTIYVYGGAIGNPADMNKFTAFVHGRGFRLIIQPDDGYFGQGNFSAWQARRKDALGEAKMNMETFWTDWLRDYATGLYPLYRDNPNIWAWAPVEEMGAEDEALYAEYKTLLRRAVPNHLIVQLDSQQAREDVLKSKRTPYPDVFAIDRYCWWHQAQGKNYVMWTPHFATQWLYNVTKEHADAVWKLYRGQAFCTLQGPAMYALHDQATADLYGWKADPNHVPPTAPTVRYYPDKKLWGAWDFYLPPANGERLSSWIAVCAGFKGMMLWAGVTGGADEAQRVIEKPDAKAGDARHAGVIHYDLSTTPQWDELSSTWRSIRRYEKAILAMQPSPAELAKAKDGHLFVNSFVDDKGRQFVVVVNGLIGEWDGGSPTVLDHPRTKLTVGPDGNLQNYTPLTEPRTCTVTLAGDHSAHDLRELAGAAK